MEKRLNDHYQLGEPLGGGTTGRVYRGSTGTGESVAIKVLDDELTGDPELVARFAGERSILTRVRHPNLVAVHDVVTTGSTVAVVQELVPGGSLRRLIDDTGCLLPSEVARIGAGVAAALHEVHTAGLLHLDLKPESILLDESEAPRRPVLTGFGISRLIAPSRYGQPMRIPGAPEYAAPELTASRPVTAAADVYALGIVLYEMCCGVTPFAGDSTYDTLRMHADSEPGRPEGIPDRLWSVITAMLAKKPAERPDAKQVAALLADMAPDFAQLPCARALTTPPDPVPLHAGATPPAGPQVPIPAGGVVRTRRRLWFVLLAVVLIVAGVLVGRALAGPGASTRAAGPADDRPVAGGAPATDQPAPSTPPLTVTPNLVGKTVTQAQDSLPASISLDTQDTIDATAPDGTILTQDPKAGDPLNGTIHVTVARQPITVYLDSLTPATGNWSSNTDVAQLGGKTYTHALQTSVDGCDTQPQSVEYNVSKGYRSLVGTAGISDSSSNSSLVVSLQFFADGRSVATASIPFGTTYPINVNLSGVLRLKIEWHTASATPTN